MRLYKKASIRSSIKLSLESKICDCSKKGDRKSWMFCLLRKKEWRGRRLVVWLLLLLSNRPINFVMFQSSITNNYTNRFEKNRKREREVILKHIYNLTNQISEHRLIWIGSFRESCFLESGSFSGFFYTAKQRSKKKQHSTPYPNISGRNELKLAAASHKLVKQVWHHCTYRMCYKSQGLFLFSWCS